MKEDDVIFKGQGLDKEPILNVIKEKIGVKMFNYLCVFMVALTPGGYMGLRSVIASEQLSIDNKTIINELIDIKGKIGRIENKNWSPDDMIELKNLLAEKRITLPEVQDSEIKRIQGQRRLFEFSGDGN